ncbi:hypothetical protein CCR75_006488 [Bremia lactucae]|uniref:Uncharacterized protein n=1 Tax=Bremia lactucae TaxID=4779 RepID=A0A976IGF2_BRELC|nr:hypothetical protein CCR75_006491 [Bremia lactucae]TDH71691.1 hypothetical protein CCR75_006488 [Bremia lactucae]
MFARSQPYTLTKNAKNPTKPASQHSFTCQFYKHFDSVLTGSKDTGNATKLLRAQPLYKIYNKSQHFHVKKTIRQVTFRNADDGKCFKHVLIYNQNSSNATHSFVATGNKKLDKTIHKHKGQEKANSGDVMQMK